MTIRMLGLAGVAVLVAVIAIVVTRPDDQERAATAIPPAASPAQTCTSACEAANMCGVALTACARDCASNHALRSCFELAHTSCARAAACAMAITCKGVVPRGTGTCKAAATCQLGCSPGDFACGCECAAAMSMDHLLVLAQLDTCAINCAYDELCMRGSCGAAGLACLNR